MTYGCTVYPDIHWTLPRPRPDTSNVDWTAGFNSAVAAAVAAGATAAAAREIARACIAHANLGMFGSTVCSRDDNTPIWVVGGMDLKITKPTYCGP